MMNFKRLLHQLLLVVVLSLALRNTCCSAAFVRPTTTNFAAAGSSRSSISISRPANALSGIAAAATTVEAPTRERTDTDRDIDTTDDNDDDYPDLEYLIDSAESREMEDPFHILLLGSTFEKPKITVTYVSGSLEYVLSMPLNEAKELSQFALDEGMACLGTWNREECLSLGRQLQVRDIVCRVVPYCEGGQRGWQAKDASSSSSNNKYSGME